MTGDQGLRTKLSFWLILGLFSTAFAEVTTGSYLLPFVTLPGLLMIVPLYTIHATAALWAVYRYGRPRFATMYLLGILFGFYEFFITKVMWTPPWGGSFSVAGIDAWSFVVLALFFHPLVSWMAAAAVTERTTVSSCDAAASLPERLARPGRLVAAVVFVVVALAHGANGGSIGAPVSAITTVAVLVLAVRWWRRDPRRTDLSLADLAPRGHQVAWVLGSLGLLYAAGTAVLRPEALPSAGTLLLTAGLYVVVAVLFAAAARRSRDDVGPTWAGPAAWWPPSLPSVAGLYVVPMMAGVAAGPVAAVPMIAAIWIGAFSGVVFFARAARYAMRRASRSTAGS